MTDERGTFEHVLLARTQIEHGYCSDAWPDVLVVAAREPESLSRRWSPGDCLPAIPSGRVGLAGQVPESVTDIFGAWEELPAVDDSWGRTIWGSERRVSRSKTV